MGTFLDISGKTFSNLTALYRDESVSKKTYWKCECVCGNIVSVWQSNLMSGQVKSCGCLTKPENLIGKSFGRWLVVDSAPNRGNVVYWKCICSCGVAREVSGASLRNERSLSCGCLSAESTKQRFTTHGLWGTSAGYHAQYERRRSRKAGVTNNWTAEMSKLIRRIFPACVLCGLSNEDHLQIYGVSLHIDHLQPLYSGNGLYPGNAVILCKPCNSRKGYQPLDHLCEEEVELLLVAASRFKEEWTKHVE